MGLIQPPPTMIWIFKKDIYNDIKDDSKFDIILEAI